MSYAFYNPLSYIDPAGLYMSAPYLWDALIFFAIFLSVGVEVYGRNKQFGKQSKTLAVVVAAALTIPLIMYTSSRGWMLASAELAILPVTILFAVFFFLLYRLLLDMLGVPKMCAASITFLFTYMAINGMFESVIQNNIARYPLLELLLALMLVVATGALIYCVVKLFGFGGGGGDGGSDGSGVSPWNFKNKKKNGADADDNKNAKKHASSDSDELAIQVIEPSKKSYSPDVKHIPIHFKITGGTKKYQSVLLLGKEPIKFEKNADVKHKLPNPGVGTHQLTLVVEDGTDHKEKEVSFTIKKKTFSTNPVSKDLQGFGDLVSRYAQLVAQQKQAANNLLQARATNQPTSQYTQEVARLADEIRKVLDNIRQATKNISKEDALTQTQPKPLNEYLVALTLFYHYSILLDNYWSAFETQYNNRQPPTKEMQKEPSL